MEITIKQAEECLRIAHILQGHYQSISNEKDNVVKKVEKAKIWLGKQPDFLKFLQHLQKVLHEKNVGVFSELLTYFVKDVLKKEKDIVFDLYTAYNLPALKIEALNDGCRESIYEGNGGSIANIVSTGLRLIALSRLNHRKFIILDEPDCWLKPDHVPVFAKIIGEISEKLKIQTVIISHHHWSYFKNYGRVIELASNGKILEANIVHDTPFNEEDKDYIKSVRLRQFMSHYDTEYKLHPYLTCLIGENDIGKSVLTTAMKSFAYNDSSDSYIKHHTNEAQILIELTKERQLLWQRFKLTNQDNPQKVKYSLYIKGDLIASEYNSSDTPKFISDELNILTTEDIDIHIGNQKQPVFLISSDVKPQQRAKILSLGKDSLFIQKMMENIKVKTKQNKNIETEGEEKYHFLMKQINVLSTIDEIVLKIEDLKSDYFRLENQLERVFLLSNLIKKISLTEKINKSEFCKRDILIPKIKDCENLKENIFSIKKTKEIIDISIVITKLNNVDLKDTKSLNELFKRISVLSKASEIKSINTSIKEVNVKNCNELEFIIKKIKESSKINSVDEIEHEFPKVEIKNSSYLKNIIEELKLSKNSIAECIEKEKNVNIWKEKIQLELEELLKENNICPTCNGIIDRKHFFGESHV